MNEFQGPSGCRRRCAAWSGSSPPPAASPTPASSRSTGRSGCRASWRGRSRTPLSRQSSPPSLLLSLVTQLHHSPLVHIQHHLKSEEKKKTKTNNLVIHPCLLSFQLLGDRRPVPAVLLAGNKSQVCYFSEPHLYCNCLHHPTDGRVQNLQPELNLPQLSSTPSIGNIKLAKYGKVSYIYEPNVSCLQ